MESTDAIFMPGDSVDIEKLGLTKKRLLIGPGLNNVEDEIVACKAGALRHREGSSMLWVDNMQKRYIATKGDSVIGIVTAKQGDSFRVDIGTSDPASLSYLSFEGATKKNRPDVKMYDIIYGKLLVANRHMEPELVCIESNGKSNGLGVIRDGGNLIHINLQWTRRLLSKECQLLKFIGQQLPFETAVGMNGRIWVKGRSLDETLVIGELIKNGEKIPDEMMKTFVTRTINRVLGVKE